MTSDKPPLRCRACQLQLCKSREELPHSALKETARDTAGRSVDYTCETCGAVMTCAMNLAEPGWAHRR